MNPSFFGAPSRRYGLYQPARAVSQGQRAVLFCYSGGSEYLYAHRPLRQLAKMLAAGAIQSLRFDYFGTGDSAGETTESSLDGWLADIESALVHTSGCARVTLIGLRLGGSSCRPGSGKGYQIEALVLSDPVISGPEYLDELWVANTMRRAERLPSARPAELGGRPRNSRISTAAFESEIWKLSLRRS